LRWPLALAMPPAKMHEPHLLHAATAQKIDDFVATAYD
jgi:hypothetical protein